MVTKAYQGPDAARRCAREAAVLRALAGVAAAGLPAAGLLAARSGTAGSAGTGSTGTGRVPVPAVLGQDDGSLRMEFMAGVHGQELIEAGLAGRVLHACGAMLARIHAIDPAMLGPAAGGGAGTGTGTGGVLVHGDYGPNNVLLDAQARAVTAVLDWEWAHRGEPVEDLAWCEWIIRMHHPAEVAALAELWAAYGWRPAWAERQRAMAAQCRALVTMCERWDPGGDSVRLWRERLAVTERWAG